MRLILAALQYYKSADVAEEGIYIHASQGALSFSLNCVVDTSDSPTPPPLPPYNPSPYPSPLRPHPPPSVCNAQHFLNAARPESSFNNIPLAGICHKHVPYSLLKLDHSVSGLSSLRKIVLITDNLLGKTTKNCAVACKKSPGVAG